MATTPRSNVSKPNREQINAFRTDMFGRTKISEAYTIFDSTHRYQDNGFYSDTTATGGTVTYNANQSTAYLNVSTASGSEVTRESFKVFPYQAGKSLQIMETFVFAPSQPNLRQRVGHFTRRNGFFLEYTQDGLFFVKRSDSTGNVIDIRVPQSEWNIDKLDGTGNSDVLLDPTKAQVMFSEMEWFGVGSTRMGFVIDGYFIIAHQFNHTNYEDTAYMTAGPQPIRHEITNLGATQVASSFKQIAASVILNGGPLSGTDIWTATRQQEVIGVTMFPLVSIRMKSGRTGSIIIPEVISLFPESSEDFEWALVRNPTIANGTWVTDPIKANVEYNITATTMSGGRNILEGFFGANNQSSVPINYGTITNFNLQLGRSNSDTPVSEVLTLAAKVVNAESGTVKASFNWFDLT
jgi:hypothetical protein